MDSVLESNSQLSNLEDEITKTIELIRRLSEAEEPLLQRNAILEAECNRLSKEVYTNKHRKLAELISSTSQEIRCFEDFPINTNEDPVKTSMPTAKEVAETIRRTKIQFHHKNTNLKTERKMARELQQQERERPQQHQVQDKGEKMEGKYRCYIINHLTLKPLAKMPIKSLIRMWAEKIECVSNLVVRDSKNSATTDEAYLHLQDLNQLRIRFSWLARTVDKADFAKEWESMKRTVNSFAQIKFDMAKENRRHKEGYAESKRVEEKLGELWKVLRGEMSTELRDLQSQKRTAQRYLLKLQKRTN